MIEYLESTSTKQNVAEGKSSKGYTSLPSPKLDRIEQSLIYIFETEMKSSDSIIIDYKPEVISRIASFISGKTKRSASIGIAGETASGKSTITLDIIETINAFATEYETDNVITRVNTDDYYYDRSQMVKEAGSFAEFAKNYDLDVPQALELELMSEHIKQLLSGNEVYLPKYDMSGTAIRYDNHTLAKPSGIVISEGLFTLTEKVRDAFDFKIYVDIREHIQKERFYIRAKERDLGSSADTIYKNASEKANIYIRPCKANADIILTGEADRARYKHFLNKIISIVQRECM
jgi:uridine kinase